MRSLAVYTALLAVAVANAATTSPSNRPPRADPLPLIHDRLAPATPLARHRVRYGLIAEQVHVALAGDERVAVSWVTARGASLSLAASRKLRHHSKKKQPSLVANCGMDDVRSVVEYGLSPGRYRWTAEGSHTCYDRGAYRSGLLHTTVLGKCCSGDELIAGQTYFYRVGDPRLGWSSEFRFRMPAGAGNMSNPLKVAVFGDLGQTQYSLQTLTHMEAVRPDLTVNLGDMSYADGDQLRWDSWGRMIEPLMSRVPMMTVEGNHDEDQGTGDKKGSYIPFQAYTLRYFAPYVSSGSGSNRYYSFEVGGAHFIMIGSYADYEKGSPQYQWLKADLAAVDRLTTPWVVVAMHKPWYSSNVNHYGSGKKILDNLEPVLYKHGVDLVLQAHVHAYERTARVFDGKLDACGPMYLTVGDGGNRQGLDTVWRKQPKWSMFREDSYGFGTLEVFNVTHMRWQWLRNADRWQVAIDEEWITKPFGCRVASPQVVVT